MQTARDVAILARRQLRATVSYRSGIFVGVTQPVLFLLLFGPIMSSVLAAQEGHVSAAWSLYVPGILVMLALFSAGYAGFALFADLHSGYQERLRATPVSPTSLLLGRLAHDVVVQLFQATLLLVLAAVLWLRAPLLGMLVQLLFVALLTIGSAALSYALALKTRHQYVFAPLISLGTLPVMLLSGILLPMSLAPRWLEVLSYLNPFRHILDGMRPALRGDLAAAEVFIGLGVAGALVAVALVVSSRSFARELA
ncbi:ABC transporter permease [Crossiella sp. CA-258035]|uniref:ABC transporter permease n=1 Tax=Crossiella sp. CA-258035 TaxID=2981138 RepID=UPI0024BCDD61|nr:ABC transporter permease [Crossiella sp. CA-258035]WHT23343.1 ABC transporter permease [Crossiella sp. CA-258035]